jgi:hypothetical protein
MDMKTSVLMYWSGWNGLNILDPLEIATAIDEAVRLAENARIANPRPYAG